MEKVKEFVEYVAKALVDYPDKVEVRETTDEMGVLISLKVAKEDMGLIVGRQGKTAQAFRELVRIAGYKQKARVSLKIEEPEGSDRQPYQPQREKEPLFGIN